MKATKRSTGAIRIVRGASVVPVGILFIVRVNTGIMSKSKRETDQGMYHGVKRITMIDCNIGAKDVSSRSVSIVLKALTKVTHSSPLTRS